MVKSSLFLNKRARHSAILKALNIPHISDLIDAQRVNLLRRIFNVNSQYTSLCKELICEFYATGTVTRNTLVGNIINLGLSPFHVIYTGAKTVQKSYNGEDGIADSIKCVLDGGFGHLRPGSMAHRTLIGLTKSFE